MMVKGWDSTWLRPIQIGHLRHKAFPWLFEGDPKSMEKDSNHD